MLYLQMGSEPSDCHSEIILIYVKAIFFFYMNLTLCLDMKSEVAALIAILQVFSSSYFVRKKILTAFYYIDTSSVGRMLHFEYRGLVHLLVFSICVLSPVCGSNYFIICHSRIQV